MSMQVPTMVIASSRRLGTRGSSILPSAMAFLRSRSRAFTSCRVMNGGHSWNVRQYDVPLGNIVHVPLVSQALALPLRHVQSHLFPLLLLLLRLRPHLHLH